MKNVDKKILRLLKNKVLTEKEIEEKLSYKQIYQRLQHLLEEGKIMRIKDNNEYFYYTDEKILKKWALKNKRISILRKISREATQYTSIGIRRIIFDIIQEKANKKGMSPSEYVEDILLRKVIR